MSKDFLVIDYGSLVKIKPFSTEAKSWVDDNLEIEDWQWLGGSLCVDYRFADDIIGGILNDGLSIAC